MTKYVFSKELGCMVEKDSGLPMINQEERARPLQAPRVFSDLPGYQSPIDGTWIEGRRARRYDLEKNNCVDANDALLGGGLKNERFIKKHGLERLADGG